MKNLNAVFLAGASLVLALISGFTGHPSTLQVFASIVVIILSLAAGGIAVIAGKREQEREAPQLFLKIDLPKEAKANPGLGITTRVMIVENNGLHDAFNVCVDPICVDGERRIWAHFKTVPRLGAHDRVELQDVVKGLKGGEKNGFETIYFYGANDAYLRDNNSRILFEASVTYTDYEARHTYRGRVLFNVDLWWDKPVEITWLGVRRLTFFQKIDDELKRLAWALK